MTPSIISNYSSDEDNDGYNNIDYMDDPFAAPPAPPSDNRVITSSPVSFSRYTQRRGSIGSMVSNNNEFSNSNEVSGIGKHNELLYSRKSRVQRRQKRRQQMNEKQLQNYENILGSVRVKTNFNFNHHPNHNKTIIHDKSNILATQYITRSGIYISNKVKQYLLSKFPSSDVTHKTCWKFLIIRSKYYILLFKITCIYIYLIYLKICCCILHPLLSIQDNNSLKSVLTFDRSVNIFQGNYAIFFIFFILPAIIFFLLAMPILSLITIKYMNNTTATNHKLNIYCWSNNVNNIYKHINSQTLRLLDITNLINILAKPKHISLLYFILFLDFKKVNLNNNANSYNLSNYIEQHSLTFNKLLLPMLSTIYFYICRIIMSISYTFIASTQIFINFIFIWLHFLILMITYSPMLFNDLTDRKSDQLIISLYKSKLFLLFGLLNY